VGDWLTGAALSAAGLAVCAVAAWWLFIQTEGVYLGPRVVRWLYDRSAGEYDQIKEFDDEADDYHLGAPLAALLAGRDDALVLDVATGTARLPLTLFRHMDFKGRVVGLDSSRGMLEVATAKTVFFAGSLDLVENDARQLPLSSGSCDAVACIEALEFLPAVGPALAEMVRVLKPGGALLVTNRRGLDRWSFPGRAPSAAQFEALLRACGLQSIQTKRWLTYYDLIWATKPENADT
jgi:ubiquinone/menaquinone biosynthesis C-methylase UbiE